MITINKIRILLILFYLFSSLGFAETDVGEEIEKAICDIYAMVINLALPLAMAIFAYGGAKYVYSADDPGGRKEGKKLCIQAIVGLILIGISCELVKMIADTWTGCEKCPTIS